MVTGTSYVETAPTDLARLLEYLFTDRCGRCRQSADDTTDRMAAMQRTLNRHRRPLALSEDAIVTVSIGLAKSFHAPPTI
jgi:hypothetical protein